MSASALGAKLASLLRGRIAASRYTREFPTENEIMREFGASRYAVRSALERLVKDGLIERHPGRGSFVREVRPGERGWIIHTVEDLIGGNLQTQARLLAAKPVPTTRFPEVAALFSLGPGRSLFLVERLAEDFFSETFMPLEVGLALPRASLAARPIILLIEESQRIRAARVRQTTAIRPAAKRVAKHLGLASGAPLPTLGRTYLDRDGGVIVHGELYYRPERFRQTIELERGEGE